MRKLFLGALLIMASSSVFAAKNFVYCSEASPEGFYPALFTSGTTFDAAGRTIYNRLVEFKNGTTEVQPGLAESWSVSNGGKTYTFKLRKGVKFHSNKSFTPTRDFNADDVLFTFNRMWDKEHPYHRVSGGTYEYFKGMSMHSLLKSITKKGDYTVIFNLNSVEAPFVANLAMEFASIASAEYADSLMKSGNKEKIDREPIGTGPFYLVQYQKDSTIRYKAFDSYWKGRAKIDNLIFAITPNASVRLQKVKAGECHVMPFPNPSDIENIKKDKRINLLSQQGLNVGYLAYNTEKKPFDNPKVRKALNMAIDKAAIIKAVYQGAGVAAKNPIPPTIWSYNDSIVDDPYDPVAAKKMLIKEGVTDLETNIWAMPVQRPYNPNARRIGELIQQDWKKVGVDAKIVSFEWGEYLKKAKSGEHDTVQLGWTGDNGDPDNFLAVLLGCDAAKNGSNYARWCNEDFEALIQKAKKTTSIKERTKLYEQAQVIFKKEAPWFTIAHSVVFLPVRKEVTGVKISPLGTHDFYGADFK
ncbi:MAG: ABC transporter substrate-binding protein [SAR324 cluster bacterium]|nr:ABC transporter substrate-binding protein [SAR324 cluster bacterium]